MKSKTLKRGQTMVEYIIIVALIAISLIAVFSYFGRATGKTVVNATKQLDETEGSSAEDALKEGGKDAIKDFNSENN